MHTYCPIAVACAVLAAVLAGCAATPKEPLLTQEQRQLNVESFEYAWTKVNDDYWDPTFGGVDWQAVHDELRPQIEHAETMSTARDVMYDMVGHLGVSHFEFIPPDVSDELDQLDQEETDRGVTGIDLRIIDGHAIVTSVAENSAAAAAGVQPGWEIVRIGDVEVVPKLHRLMEKLKESSMKRTMLTVSVMAHLFGTAGDPVRVEFLDGHDAVVTHDLILGEPKGQRTDLGYLRNLYVWIDVRELDDDIGYIRFNGFFHPTYVMKTYNEAMVRFMNANGLIIDLRGNGGGMGIMALGMLGWLIPEEAQLGTMYMRDNELKFVVQPRPKTYAGPIVVLVDELSGSAAEFFAGGIQEWGRACIVGTPTCGAALPAQFEQLPNGDVFLFATANFLLASGKTIEGVGVSPDIEVHPSRAALLAGRDEVIDAAVAWIGNQH